MGWSQEVTSPDNVISHPQYAQSPLLESTHTDPAQLDDRWQQKSSQPLVKILKSLRIFVFDQHHLTDL